MGANYATGAQALSANTLATTAANTTQTFQLRIGQRGSDTGKPSHQININLCSDIARAAELTGCF